MTVKRQAIIGNYIVDFYIDSKLVVIDSKLVVIDSKLVVIEIDGLQHKTSEHKEADKRRDEELAFLGIKVLRYSNKDVNYNFINVCKDILDNLGLTAEDMKK